MIREELCTKYPEVYGYSDDQVKYFLETNDVSLDGYSAWIIKEAVDKEIIEKLKKDIKL